MILELRIALAALVLAGLVWGGFVVHGWKEKADQLESVAEAAQQADTSTQGATGEVQSAITETQRIDIVVSQSRTGILEQYNELRNNDPTVSAFSNTPVPERMRQLARARRLEREGAASHGVGGASNVAPSPTER